MVLSLFIFYAISCIFAGLLTLAEQKKKTYDLGHGALRSILIVLAGLFITYQYSQIIDSSLTFQFFHFSVLIALSIFLSYVICKLVLKEG